MMQTVVKNARQPLLLAFCVVASGCALDAQTDAGVSGEEPVGTAAAELSRSDFGMSRSLSVLDSSGSWETVPLPAWSLPTTDSTARGPLADAGVTSFTNLSWVGDANSYIDVFDSSWISTISLFGTPITVDGSSSGRFFRVFYPYASDAQITLTFPPPLGGVVRFPRAVNVALPAGS